MTVRKVPFLTRGTPFRTPPAVQFRHSHEQNIVIQSQMILKELIHWQDGL